MSPTTLEQLETRYKEILRDLVREDDRSIRAALVIELQDNVRAKQALAGRKFSHCRRPIDAIVAFLEERGIPATEDEIIAGVIAGGFGRANEEERNPIFWSMRVFLNGKSKSKGTLRWGPDGKLVGLGTWTDERFEG